MSYHLTTRDAVVNAATLVRAGAEAVKLEGGRSPPGVLVEAIMRRRDPGHGPPRASPRSFQAGSAGGHRVAGPQRRRRRAAPRRGQGPGAEAGGLRHRAWRGCPSRGQRRTAHRGHRRADHRHRRQVRAATKQVWSSTTSWAWGRAPRRSSSAATPNWSAEVAARRGGRLLRRRAGEAASPATTESYHASSGPDRQASASARTRPRTPAGGSDRCLTPPPSGNGESLPHEKPPDPR